MNGPSSSGGLHVLVVGGGGREHALAWACSRSPLVDRISSAPGNPGTQALGANWELAATDSDGIAARAFAESVDLAILGPDAAIAAGVADRLQLAGVPCFGPSRAAGELETSKAFAKALMARVGIRTAPFVVCRDVLVARRELLRWEGQVVVKADGPALGKGVFVCSSNSEAELAVERLMVGGVLGEAGRAVVIEERLAGQEVSLFAICDGGRAVMLPPACDYKRAFDCDLGPNTGGMGSYSPPRGWAAQELNQRALDEVVLPTLGEMARLGRPFRGCLYVGAIMSGGALTVLEFNARFGDPEAEVLLPLLEDPVPHLLQAAAGRLELPAPERRTAAAVGVVAVKEPYPEPIEAGGMVRGIDRAESLGCHVFQMGTRSQAGGGLEILGGRVLICVATGADVVGARRRAYSGMDQIRFPGMRYRSDIAA